MVGTESPHSAPSSTAADHEIQDNFDPSPVVVISAACWSLKVQGFQTIQLRESLDVRVNNVITLLSL